MLLGKQGPDVALAHPDLRRGRYHDGSIGTSPRTTGFVSIAYAFPPGGRLSTPPNAARSAPGAGGRVRWVPMNPVTVRSTEAASFVPRPRSVLYGGLGDIGRLGHPVTPVTDRVRTFAIIPDRHQGGAAEPSQRRLLGRRLGAPSRVTAHFAPVRDPAVSGIPSRGFGCAARGCPLISGNMGGWWSAPASRSGRRIVPSVCRRPARRRCSSGSAVKVVSYWAARSRLDRGRLRPRHRSRRTDRLLGRRSRPRHRESRGTVHRLVRRRHRRRRSRVLRLSRTQVSIPLGGPRPTAPSSLRRRPALRSGLMVIRP